MNLLHNILLLRFDNIISLCDVYKFTIKNLIHLSKHCVKELFWKEFVHSVFCDKQYNCISFVSMYSA